MCPRMRSPSRRTVRSLRAAAFRPVMGRTFSSTVLSDCNDQGGRGVRGLPGSIKHLSGRAGKPVVFKWSLRPEPVRLRAPARPAARASRENLRDTRRADLAGQPGQRGGEDVPRDGQFVFTRCGDYPRTQCPVGPLAALAQPRWAANPVPGSRRGPRRRPWPPEGRPRLCRADPPRPSAAPGHLRRSRTTRRHPC